MRCLVMVLVLIVVAFRDNGVGVGAVCCRVVICRHSLQHWLNIPRQDIPATGVIAVLCSRHRWRIHDWVGVLVRVVLL